jgi:hypothetical protein
MIAPNLNAVSIIRRRLYVVNNTENSITEWDVDTGALVGTIRGSGYGFNNPDTITTCDGNVIIGNNGNDSLTQISLMARKQVRRIAGLSGVMACGGGTLYVADWADFAAMLPV